MIEIGGIVCLLGAFGWLLWWGGRQPKEMWRMQGARVVRSFDGDWRTQYLNFLKPKLERAGISKEEAKLFFFRQFLHTAFAFVGALALTFFGGPPLLVLVAPTLAAFYPMMKLNSQIRKRQRSIFFALPYYLDLLTLALEAGLDLIAAVEEVVRKDRPSPLQQELLITLSSIRMGTVRAAAFTQLAERTGVDPLALVASAITQSEELGSSLGGILRLQSESLRRQIFRDAEESAQKAPVKLLLPLIAFIFPVVFILLFTPIAMQFFM